MTDFDYENVIVDLVNDTVVTHPDAAMQAAILLPFSLVTNFVFMLLS